MEGGFLGASAAPAGVLGGQWPAGILGRPEDIARLRAYAATLPAFTRDPVLPPSDPLAQALARKIRGLRA